MATSYKKLWKLLIERDMKKKDLNNKTRIFFADDRVKAIRIYKLK
jgi:DNA-binding Xre family transcriptional regulator